MKRLFKVLATIENIIGGIAILGGMFFMCTLTNSWTIFFITRGIALLLLAFGFWELENIEKEEV